MSIVRPRKKLKLNKKNKYLPKAKQGKWQL